MGSGGGLRYCVVAVASRWRLLVAFAVVGALAGFGYGMTYSSDDEDLLATASTTAMVMVEGLVDSEEYPTKLSLAKSSVNLAIDSGTVFDSFNEDGAAGSDNLGNEAVSADYIADRVTISHDASAIVTVVAKSDTIEEAEYLLEVSLLALEEKASSVVGEDVGRVSLASTGVKSSYTAPSDNNVLLQAAAFCILALGIGAFALALLAFMKNYVTYSSLVLRYRLPVFGPYHLKGKRSTLTAGNYEGVYVGFPHKAQILPADACSSTSEEVKRTILLTKENLEEEGAVDLEIASGVDCIKAKKNSDSDVKVVLAVCAYRTTHYEVDALLCMLDVYDLAPDAFCLVD